MALCPPLYQPLVENSSSAPAPSNPLRANGSVHVIYHADQSDLINGRGLFGILLLLLLLYISRTQKMH